MRAISIDLGDARTGVAISDLSNTLASPLCVIAKKDVDTVLNEVFKLVKEYNITDVIIGLPKNMNGTEGARAKLTKEFKEKLEKLTGIQATLIDERWSTKAAQNYLNYGTTRPRKKKQMLDKVAATLILQQYLDSKNFKK